MKTKKVRMLVNMASPEQSFDVSRVYEFKAEDAERLIKAGFAEAVDEVQTSTVKPPENAAKRAKKG